MAVEIERKFIVGDSSILAGRVGFRIRQGYLAKEGMTVRVRTFGEAAFLTLKGPTSGISRDEYEYPIPVDDALQLLDRYCGLRVIHKTRYLVPHAAHTVEVDVFSGKLRGLIMAEIELSSEDERVELPTWLGREVTHDPRFGNFSLALAEEPPLPLSSGARRSPPFRPGL